MVFRIPWKLWRHLEGGKIAEFGLEAKRNIIEEENSEAIAHQVCCETVNLLRCRNVREYYFLIFRKIQA